MSAATGTVPIQLAVPGDYIPNTATADDVYTDKAGGKPLFPRSRIEDLVCNWCNSPLYLITQLYVPLKHAVHAGKHRHLFVFGCNNGTCKEPEKNVVAYRILMDAKPTSTPAPASTTDNTPASNQSTQSISSQPATSTSSIPAPTSTTVTSTPASKTTTKKISSDDDWGDAGEWGMDSDEDVESVTQSLENLLKSREQQIAQQTKSTPSTSTKLSTPSSTQSHSGVEPKSATKSAPSVPVLTPHFRPFYLLWEVEPDSTTTESFEREQHLLKQYEAEEQKAKTAGGSGEQWQDEYESSGDKWFRKFTKRIRRKPEQCIRYGYKSTPLSSVQPRSPQNPLLIENCECGSNRVFEFQLMPTLLYELHVDTHDVHNIGMEWTTIDVYTCEKGCNVGDYVQEYAHITNVEKFKPINQQQTAEEDKDDDEKADETAQS